MIASRLAYVGGVGVMLVWQDRRRYFTRRLGVEAGFRRFRRIASIIMNNDGVAFCVLCFVTRGTMHLPWPRLVVVALGLVLCIAGIGVKVWAAARLGADAYYWHNFFAPDDLAPLDPPGPYRYLDNPMYTVGYLHTYGLALILQSEPGMIGAFFVQLAILVFHYAVEKPHFDRLVSASRLP